MKLKDSTLSLDQKMLRNNHSSAPRQKEIEKSPAPVFEVENKEIDKVQIEDKSSLIQAHTIEAGTFRPTKVPSTKNMDL